MLAAVRDVGEPPSMMLMINTSPSTPAAPAGPVGPIIDCPGGPIGPGCPRIVIVVATGDVWRFPNPSLAIDKRLSANVI